MKTRLYIFASLIFSLSFSLIAQNAADYFPSEPGYKWFYKTIPYDSLNHPVDSLSYVSVDSFAINQDFNGKPAKFVLSKIGTNQTVLQSPYSDTSYVSLDSANILNYTGSVPGIDTVGLGFLQSKNDWYSVYRLTQTLNSLYTIFTKDTVVNINGLNITFTTEVKGKRIADQLTTTGLGNFLCKKFILSFTIKTTILILPITLSTINDTIYIAPGNYIVRDVRPSSNVDLTVLGQPSFYIPGSRMDIMAPPAILNVDQEKFSIKYISGDSSVTIFNTGTGILNWKASVASGNSWLHLTDSSGEGNGVIRFSFTQNNDNSLRVGTITISDSAACGSPQVITITQDAYITSITDKNKIPLQFNLFQNYPNPFNPSTIINYSLPKEGNVRLIVYNAIGSKVITVVDEYKTAGNYSVQFNGSNLASGIYLYRLEAGTFSDTKKFILLK
jgi:hypothetical protein